MSRLQRVQSFESLLKKKNLKNKEFKSLSQVQFFELFFQKRGSIL